MSSHSSTSRWTLTEATLSVTTEGGAAVLRANGDWVLSAADHLEDIVSKVTLPAGRFILDLADMGRLDTAGALILNRLLKTRVNGLETIVVRNADESHRVLIEEVHDKDRPRQAPPAHDAWYTTILLALGRVGVGVWVDVRDINATLGGAALYFVRWLIHPGRIRIHSCSRQIQRMAIEALPIIALMSFLIGAIIAQQGAFYFRRFGAELYVVDMVGVLTLREIGVLLTAIMVAGRTGSSITAEIGSMKMREEVDALRVIGLDPVEVLVLPRLIGLVVAMPILTLVSDLAAILGSAIVSVTYIDLPIDTFLFRLKEAVTLQTAQVGLLKAPFMALIIGLIACVEGLQVKGSAESLGEQTTIAVVKSIFMVVVVDGLFAIFFAAADI